jgi:hypothetical protein
MDVDVSMAHIVRGVLMVLATTLGTTDLVLPPAHRMVGAFESAGGHDDVRLVDGASGGRGATHRPASATWSGMQ